MYGRLSLLFLLSGVCTLINTTALATCQMKDLRLVYSQDVGHGGSQIDLHVYSDQNQYVAVRSETRSFPRPGESDFKPSTKEEKLQKSQQEISTFLNDVTQKFKLFELKDVHPKVVLHPTSYQFSVSDSCDKTNSFKYTVEGSHATDEQYEQLITLMKSFFGM